MGTPSYHDERLSSTEKQAIRISYPGIAARLDRLPSGTWHRKVMFLWGGVSYFAIVSICTWEAES